MGPFEEAVESSFFDLPVIDGIKITPGIEAWLLHGLKDYTLHAPEDAEYIEELGLGEIIDSSMEPRYMLPPKRMTNVKATPLAFKISKKLKRLRKRKNR